MAVNFNDIINFLVPSVKEEQLGQIIIDYGNLKKKLANPEKQNWYFNKAIDSHRTKLIELRREYNKFKNDVNNFSLDDLIENLNIAIAEKEKLDKKTRLNTCYRILYESLISKIAYCKELIDTKTRTAQIRDIDFYIENSNELLAVLGLDRSKTTISY